ncbi:hypothetical protein FBY24_3229 [Cellulomonas sp. SLBN-39]|nr:hypothetical protein FBY24_3229 [Cellulomonas sp. SLBN-39]
MRPAPLTPGAGRLPGRRPDGLTDRPGVVRPGANPLVSDEETKITPEG